MYKFDLRELTHYHCKSKVFALGVNGRFPYSEFVAAIKNGTNYENELGDLIPAIKYFADGKMPPLPNTRFKKLKLKKVPLPVYEVKSDHLRVYLFTDGENGIINICGGYKTGQDKDIPSVERIVKEYHQQQLQTRKQKKI